MKWEHCCDFEWLKARQKFLTATDIYELLPFTSTGRPRKIDKFKYMKVLSKKMIKLTQDNCISTGTAARGHILEPYAIKMANEEYHLNLYHWDDVIIDKRLVHEKPTLAFSPDACNIPMIKGAVVVHCQPEYIGEVKCYGADKHLQLGHIDKDKIEERWQIATAMAVCPSIKEGYLILFNPSMTMQMFMIPYSYSELKDEIKIVNQIESDWLDFIDDEMPSLKNNMMRIGDNAYEHFIIRELEQRNKLKP